MERARGAQRDTIGWYVSALDRLSLAGQLLASANALYLLVLLPGGPGFFDRFAQGMALIFCGMGLSMAIPATAGRFWLLSRIRRLTIDMLLGSFASTKINRSEEAVGYDVTFKGVANTTNAGFRSSPRFFANLTTEENERKLTPSTLPGSAPSFDWLLLIADSWLLIVKWLHG